MQNLNLEMYNARSKIHILSLDTCYQGIKTNSCRYNTLQLFCCIGVVKVGIYVFVAFVTYQQESPPQFHFRVSRAHEYHGLVTHIR